MKIYIMTDLEGISGIDRMDMIQEGHERYEYSISRLMADTNAAVEGAISGGATKVTVRDGHGGGGNFIPEMLDKRAGLSCGSIAEDLDRSYDALMFIGTHAMAGTLNGFLDHTQNSKKWFNYYVNARKTGEIGQWAIMGAQYDLPVIMVSGDEAACVEAKQFLGSVECAVVKYGRGRNSAELVNVDRALDEIRRAARDSISLIDKIKPFKPLLPLEIKLELYRSDFCDEIAQKPGVERLDARTVRKISRDYLDIFF